MLVSTPWCHESSTGPSFHTTKLRFHPNGWELVAGLLIIHEPNGGESRLPMTVAASSRGLRLTLGKVTYAVCR